MYNDDFDGFFNLFDSMWNRFDLPVKDMSPYSVYPVDGKGFILVCKTLGIAKEDLDVKIEKEKGQGFPVLKIKGETKLEKINIKNKVDLAIKLKFDKDLEDVSYEVKDGLTIVYLKTKEPEKEPFTVKYIEDNGESLDW